MTIFLQKRIKLQFTILTVLHPLPGQEKGLIPCEFVEVLASRSLSRGVLSGEDLTNLQALLPLTSAPIREIVFRSRDIVPLCPQTRFIFSPHL